VCDCAPHRVADEHAERNSSGQSAGRLAIEWCVALDGVRTRLSSALRGRVVDVGC
jgi:hypothetical protein